MLCISSDWILLYTCDFPFDDTIMAFIFFYSVSISELVTRVPIILIFGVVTTMDAPRKLLPSHVLQHLCPCKFILGSPAERMDSIIEAVLVKHCTIFSISHKVALFLRNYFLNKDGTLTSFIRALKVGNTASELLSFVIFLCIMYMIMGDMTYTFVCHVLWIHLSDSMHVTYLFGASESHT